MMKLIRIKPLVMLIALSITSITCTTLQDQDEIAKTEGVTIDDDMPLEEALDNAIKYGGKTLIEVKKLIKKRQAWNQTRALTRKLLFNDLNKMPDKEVLNAVHLYKITGPRVSPRLVFMLIWSTKQLIAQIGWQLAASDTNKKISVIIENRLSDAIHKGEEQKILIPDMARAVRIHALTDVYTIIRQGLMLHGNSEFGETMIALSPIKASYDFMDYLARATIEDLRQLNQKSINLHTCLVIFRHLLNYPTPVFHPKYSHMFLYAISRNQALSEMANVVIENQSSLNRQQMAEILARLPVWIQIAFIEKGRENLNPRLSLFLTQLKTTTAYKEVIDEIESIKQ